MSTHSQTESGYEGGVGELKDVSRVLGMRLAEELAASGRNFFVKSIARPRITSRSMSKRMRREASMHLA